LTQDLLYTFNPRTKKFRSLGFDKADGVERFDVKIHRSLCLDDQGLIYGATACLHSNREYNQAPGGKLFRYDPRRERIEVLAIPMPHLYIQSIALDSRRQIIYGCTYPTSHLFRYDIATGRTRDLGLIQDDPHRPVVDRAGRLWATYRSAWPMASAGIELLSYDPDRDRLDYGPWPASCQLIKKAVDDMCLGPDGLIYIGAVTGELLRLDPDRREMEYLGKPFHGRRLDTRFGSDGRLYLASGYGSLKADHVPENTGVFTYDTKRGTFAFQAHIFDERLKQGCVMVHDIAVTDDRIAYVAESDNLTRSCYLWECRLEDR
jgi:sugar lactone lactonase YvrE